MKTDFEPTSPEPCFHSGIWFICLSGISTDPRISVRYSIPAKVSVGVKNMVEGLEEQGEVQKDHPMNHLEEGTA